MQNLKESINSVMAESGVRGFWSGFMVSLPLCLHGTIKMQVYEACKKFFK
jgi:hypothetical protein